ncbi:hypothetical protein HERIO_319 [Hepatospora eriocheir]|uniref:Uncharacterized protein n=1 Tax=Hepatospora eriocheir TaxID=1081669 RepID=A0A1X0QDX1_9MICR|nr:hypothetical protein HERIO_319 [Hepatospora eriocheir]
MVKITELTPEQKINYQNKKLVLGFDEKSGFDIFVMFLITTLNIILVCFSLVSLEFYKKPCLVTGITFISFDLFFILYLIFYRLNYKLPATMFVYDLKGFFDFSFLYTFYLVLFYNLKKSNLNDPDLSFISSLDCHKILILCSFLLCYLVIYFILHVQLTAFVNKCNYKKNFYENLKDSIV